MSEVDVEEFARVFVKTAADLPSGGVNRYDPSTDRFYFRVDFDAVESQETLTGALTTLRKRYDVEVVHRVTGGVVAKERRYVEAENDVPDQYKIEHGPHGGIYYETNPSRAGGGGSAEDDVGYDGQPVYAVVSDYVNQGDQVAFEREDGSRDVGKVTEVGDETVTVETGDATLEVEPAPFGTDGSVDKSEACERCGENPRERGDLCSACESDVAKEGGDGGDGGDTLTSETDGVHNDRYSEDEDEEEDYPEVTGGDVQKAETWVSYVGPDGGKGWLNPATCEVRYQAERPGAGAEGDPQDDMWDGYESFEGDLSALEAGDIVQYEHNGEIKESPVEFQQVDETGKVWLEDHASFEAGAPGLNEESIMTVQPAPDEPETAAEADTEESESDDQDKGELLSIQDSEDLFEGIEVVVQTETMDQPELTEVVAINDSGSVEVEDGKTIVPSAVGDAITIPNEHWEPPGDDMGDVSDDEFASMEDVDEAAQELLEEIESGEESATVEYDGYEWDDISLGDTVTVGDTDYEVTEEPPVENGFFTVEDADGEEAQFQAWEVDDLAEGSVEGDVDAGTPDMTGSDASAEGSGEATTAEPADAAVPETASEADETDAGWEAYTSDYDMSEYDEADFTDWSSLGEWGFPSGVSAHAMDVGVRADVEYDDPAEVSNSDLVFRRTYGSDGLDPEEGHRQMVSYTIGSVLGGNMPQHVGHAEEDGYVVAEGVEGEDVGSAPDEYLEKVDEDDFYDQAAVQVILGNNDAHMQNVKVTEGGDVVFHDIDHSAGDITGDFVGEKSQYDDSIDRVLGELYRSGKFLTGHDEQEFRARVMDRAQDLAAEHAGNGTGETDEGYDTFAQCVRDEAGKDDPEAFCASIFFGNNGDNELAQALMEAVGYSAELTNNVQGNIEALAAGDVQW